MIARDKYVGGKPDGPHQARKFIHCDISAPCCAALLSTADHHRDGFGNAEMGDLSADMRHLVGIGSDIRRIAYVSHILTYR